MKKGKLLKINQDNYYTKEIDKQYMSVSQFKKFERCEAAAMAKLRGEYEEPKGEALLFGSYVHSWLDGTVDEFKKEHPELFSSRGKSKGQLKSAYQNANQMIKALESDPFIMEMLTGQHEVVMTGELFGIPWKIRMDVYNPEAGRFSDLKTVKAIRNKYWHDTYGYCSFVEAYGYIKQLAVYSEIERQNSGRKRWLDNSIVAISKEPIPDREVITVDRQRLEDELDQMEPKVKHITRIKAGKIKPKRCENCDYCKLTRQITGPTHYLDLVKIKKRR